MTTILCIDDDPKMLQAHEAILGTKGYTVLTALDGLAGIAVTRTYTIDIVVTDFHMPPGMDGIEVAELLLKEKPTLPVVIYSGCPDDIPKRLKCYVLSKGDGPNNLLSIVGELVALKALQQPAKKRCTQKKSAGTWRRKAS
jgi:CheY-like chemotaxis protein